MSDTEAFIRVEGLRLGFGEQEVLKGVDLKVMRGETLVLLGGSGTGKSVLMKAMMGLLGVNSGRVFVEGVDISNMAERELGEVREKMGMMFQNGALFDSMTVGENIAFPLREGGVRDEGRISERVGESLEIVNLAGEEGKMPAELSGGMRKRVALARAIVDKPACVMYDEPHAGLDPITADTIDHLVKTLQRDHGMTNVIVTHEMRSVFRIADRVAFLRDGKVYWVGSAVELQESEDPVLREFRDGDSGVGW